MGHYGVSEGFQPGHPVRDSTGYSGNSVLPISVQPRGNPIKASTHSGFKLPSATTFSASEFLFCWDAVPLHFASLVVGVGKMCHEEYPCPPVRRPDSQSFKIPNPDLVAEMLQILADVIGGKGKDARDVLSNDPTRANLSDQPRKLRPQESIVVPSFPVTSHGEGLAWESSVNNVNCSDIRTLHLPHVLKQRHIRPVFPKYLPAERINLAHRCHDPTGLLER